MTIASLPADTQGTRYNTQGQSIGGFKNIDRGLSAVGGSVSSRGNEFEPTVGAAEGIQKRVICMLPDGYLFDKDGKPTSGFKHLNHLT